MISLTHRSYGFQHESLARNRPVIDSHFFTMLVDTGRKAD